MSTVAVTNKLQGLSITNNLNTIIHYVSRMYNFALDKNQN
jgi:hypothetical protein